MKRRTFIFALGATLLPATIARADDDPAEDWVEWLEDAGYRDIAVTRTLLGRVQIRARLGAETREIVLNPRTEEVLRDVWIDAQGATRPTGGPPNFQDDDRHNSGGGTDKDGGKHDGSHG